MLVDLKCSPWIMYGMISLLDTMVIDRFIVVFLQRLYQTHTGCVFGIRMQSNYIVGTTLHRDSHSGSCWLAVKECTSCLWLFCYSLMLREDGKSLIKNCHATCS